MAIVEMRGSSRFPSCLPGFEASLGAAGGGKVEATIEGPGRVAVVVRLKDDQVGHINGSGEFAGADTVGVWHELRRRE
jgi:hypothetical protein